MDFHTFNTCFRDREEYEIVCFTATQIPDIAGRKYPPILSGKLYPEGIPIFAEDDLESLIDKFKADVCVLAYSDLPHETVMHKASRVISKDCDFWLLGKDKLQIKSNIPVISICAVRTGVGKSQTTRKVAEVLKANSLKVVVSRHPMPYGDLSKQICQRYETFEDLNKHECTIEEREEYEPHIANGSILYAGVDYAKILKTAEAEGFEVMLWDGGNNDISFFKSDLHIVLCDGKRAGHEIRYHPGEINLRTADILIINKIKDSDPKDVEIIKANIKKCNPTATVIDCSSIIKVIDPEKLKGKKVLVVEDGPSTTHGDLNSGAGTIAALRYGCERIDPKPFAVGSIKDTFDKFPHLDKILPAMGYGDTQIKELEQTINSSDAEMVLAGTPIDLTKIIKINKPIMRVSYDYGEIGSTNKLEELLTAFIKEKIKQ